MRRFNPDREGAAHTVDATDLVLLRGTPVWDEATNATIDIRLRVDTSGNAEKAAWIHYRISDATSVRDEFRRWNSTLESETVDTIRSMLASMDGYPLVGDEAEADYSNDLVRCMICRDGDEVNRMVLPYPLDQFGSPPVSAEHSSRFLHVWDWIHNTVPGKLAEPTDPPESSS